MHPIALRRTTFLLCVLVTLARLISGCSKPSKVQDSSCIGNLSRLGKGLSLCIADHGATTNMPLMISLGYAHPADTQCPVLADGKNKGTYRCVIGLRDSDPQRCVVAYCPPANHHSGKGHILYLDGSVDRLENTSFDDTIRSDITFWGTSNNATIVELKARTHIWRAQ